MINNNDVNCVNNDEKNGMTTSKSGENGYSIC